MDLDLALQQASELLQLQQPSTNDDPPLPDRAQFQQWVATTIEHYLSLQADHFSPVPSVDAEFQLAIIQRLTTAPIEVTLRLVDESESAELNHQHRHKNHPTNILSFAYFDQEDLLDDTDDDQNGDHTNPHYLGDLVACIPVILAEAETQHKTPIEHWAHLTIHGTLHLLGYDHETDQDANIMEGIEVEIMTQLGYSDPWSDD